ncbi:hypothetical protein N7414_05440 [Pseudomonas sp. GD04087]|uniref:hypothetical protein n=1 Tax=unclassified Pseudomonas TaxID=196821 RepID=UPI00244A4C72|nr:MULTISPECIES: hypothetical protein [unclassified Pseudomonas]MDH0288550.1 hypothetical protein [Pseudomonas sp. GD04087]MDH1051650.1 hypothetical protein [Pseudomonas sp. GD03903]MDH2000591.1 hypothetical protein [Pseudomonas sp. GD03691]
MTQQNTPAVAQTPANANSGVQQYQLTPVADTAPVVVNVEKELSGAQWVERFPTSRQTVDLISPFRENVDRFIAALSSAGVGVDISATLRPPERAYLMHYCTRIAAGAIAPQDVPEMEGVDIEWVHRDAQGQIDLARSKQAARAMKSAYQIVHPPALVSRHSQGRAIDMTLSNVMNRNVVNGQGVEILISSSAILYQVGSSYGVRKLVSDAPHWSDDGH